MKEGTVAAQLLEANLAGPKSPMVWSPVAKPPPPPPGAASKEPPAKDDCRELPPTTGAHHEVLGGLAAHALPVSLQSWHGVTSPCRRDRRHPSTPLAV